MYHNPVEVFETDNWQEECHIIQEKIKIYKPLVVTSNGNLIRHNLDSVFNSESIISDIDPDPTFASCQAMINLIDSSKYDGVIAIGGGSVMDTAKVALAYMRTGNCDLAELLTITELYENRVPSIFIPTTHGTGGEVTMWGTIWDMVEKKKYSISHPDLYPTATILDGNLTLSLPLDISIITVMDALSHSFEAIWNKNANATSTSYAIQAISLIINNVRDLMQNTNNLKIRTNLLIAANKAGLAFSNTKTAAAHSISYPLTIYYGIKHGIAASISLPWLLEINKLEIEEELNIIYNKLNLKDFSELQEILIELVMQNGKNRLRKFGVDKHDLNWLVNQSNTKGRMENNIVDLTNLDIMEILKKIY